MRAGFSFGSPGVGMLDFQQLFLQSPTLDDQGPMAVRCTEEGPGPGIFGTELGDQRQPSRSHWAIREGQDGVSKGSSSCIPYSLLGSA